MRALGLRSQITALGRQSSLLFLAITVANASNYVFHVVISRMMGPGEYGALGAVLAILIFLSVPLGAIQTTVAKRLAEQGENADWIRLFRTIAPVGVVVTALLAAAAPLIQSFLRLESIWTVLFVALYMLPALLLTLCRGVLQGQLRFTSLAVASLVPMLVRLAVGIPVVRSGGGVAGAVAASLVGETIGLLVALWMLKRATRSSVRRHWDWTFLREVLPVLAGLAAMWLVVELDLVMARRYLAPEAADAYAAAGLLARAVLFVPGAVSLVALPHFSRQRGRGEDAHRWLLASVALVAGLGTFAALVLGVGRHLIIDVTFQERYAAAGDLLPLLAFAMVGMGLANLLVFFHIAAGSRVFQVLWMVAVVEATAIVAMHDSSQTLAVIVAATAWGSALFSFFAARSVSLSPTLSARLPTDLQLHRAVEHDEEADAPELSLVVPTYNAGPSLSNTIATMLDELGRLGQTYEVIVVSDGSTDDSPLALAQMSGSVHVIHYTRRYGKGVALRVGMTRARGKYVAFVDGDGDLDASELKSFLTLMSMYDPDMVIGSKRHPLSHVEYPATRRLMSWAYQRLVRVLFGLNVRDTQTGMKLIRRDVLDAVLPRMLEKRFAFDLEFLVVANRLGYRRFFEAPVRLEYKFASTVSPRAVVRILLDTAAIFYRCYLLRFYDYPVHERPVGAPAYSAQLASLAEHAAGP